MCLSNPFNGIKKFSTTDHMTSVHQQTPIFYDFMLFDKIAETEDEQMINKYVNSYLEKGRVTLFTCGSHAKESH